MGFVKVIKSKAYFSRYQTKFRRRREGKTDYRARKRLITQDKNKYASPKYRLVVRFSNKDIICQVVRAKIVGDEVVAAAYGHELTRFGFPVNTTNYAASYATGLLLARRLLQKLKLDTRYAGNTGDVGEDYNVEPLDNGPRPFLCLLDVGLRRTTTGNRVFAALKGAVDGGLNVPHSEKRFVGYDSEESKLNSELLRKHILGGHVADFMNHLKDDDEDAYNRQFSKYIAAGIKPDQIEGLWKKVHAAIRANPAFVKKEKAAFTGKPYKRDRRATLAQRKDRIRRKLAKLAKKKAAAVSN